MKNGILALALFGLFHVTSSYAGSPACAGAVAVDNAQALRWKTSTPNEFQARAHVSGTVGRIYPDKTGHHHFQLMIGAGDADAVEIIYNEDFAKTPDLRSGMSVEACGDFINEFEPAHGYPASPDGALVHWVHRSTNPKKHPSGYLLIDGVLYN